jgi:hypothetical protein
MAPEDTATGRSWGKNLRDSKCQQDDSDLVIVSLTINGHSSTRWTVGDKSCIRGIQYDDTSEGNGMGLPVR